MPNYKRYYIENSMVFITAVTNKRKPLLLKNIDILRRAVEKSRYYFEVYAAVILPEHFHLILKPENIKELPKIISSIKYYFSTNLDFEKTDKTGSEIKRKEKGVWQRRYYDHINDKRLYKLLTMKKR